MIYIKSADKKAQSYHWMPLADVRQFQFMTEGGDPAYMNCLDFSELQGGRAKTVRFHMATQYDDTEKTIVYNVWFADSTLQLTRSISLNPPTKIVSSSWPYGLPSTVTFNPNAKYMAINIDNEQSDFNPETTAISIYVS
jgi:hypothetical protein